jgi:putative hydrolase of the HAD superfamily
VIDAVLFDWGGTLTPVHNVDLLGAWVAAARVIAPDREDEVSSAMLAAERECWQRTEDSLLSFTTEELVRSVCQAAGIDDEPAMLVAATHAYLGEWAPFMASRPEAVGIVRSLKERGLRTGILSNTHWPREWHEAALATDGLLDLIDARVYTCEIAYMKPHPTAFTTLLEAVGTTADNAVFVGDRRHDDISGAKAIGMRTVWLRNDLVPGYDVEPDATIDELAELPAVIDGWRQTDAS